MRRIIAARNLDGSIQWQRAGDETPDCISVGFKNFGKMNRHGRVEFEKGVLDRPEFPWIWQKGHSYFIDLDLLRRSFDTFKDVEWMKGFASIAPSITLPGNFIAFDLYYEDYVVDRRTKIFLSHKSADKPMVRRFYAVLKSIGFDPWLDEEEMPAGTEPHRGMKEGFDLSCAAVFFLTPKYKDDRFLRSEINYAKDEKIKKGDRFAIISIVLTKNKSKVEIPELLKEFIYTYAKTELDALREILRALPLELGAPSWKPKFRP
jgi:hypothetical protein